MILHHSCLKVLLLIAIVSTPYSFYAQNNPRRIILKRGIPLSKQLKQENTTYVIKHKFELSENVYLPSGCTLDFKGGSISGNNHHVRLLGNNTVRNGKFINTGITLDGENAFIENNIFNITSQSNIGYGVIGSDAFGGTVIIRNNTISNPTQFGTITLCLPSWRHHAKVLIEKNKIMFSQIGITINARPRQLGYDSVKIYNNSIYLYKPSRFVSASKEMWGMAVSLERDIDYAEVSDNYIEGCIGLELAGTNNAEVKNNVINVFGTDTFMKRAIGIYQSDESFYTGGTINILNNRIEVEGQRWSTGGDASPIYISFAQNHNFNICDNILKGGQLKLVQARNYIKNNKSLITLSHNEIELMKAVPPLVFGLEDRGDSILYNIVANNNTINTLSDSKIIRCYNTNYSGNNNCFISRSTKVDSSGLLLLSPSSIGSERNVVITTF